MIMDIQKSSESLSVATSDRSHDRVLEKPGFMAVRSWHRHLLLHLSLSVHFPAWICTHMHMWAFTWARPKHTSVGCWWRGYTFFCYESGEVFLLASGVSFSLIFPQSPGALSMPPWSSKDPWNRNQTAPPSTSVSPVGELSSTPPSP